MKHVLLASLIILSFLLGSCRRSTQQNREAPHVNMSLAVEPEAPTVGPATLLITLTDADGNPINGAALEIRGDMSHAGMEPVLASAEAGQTGIYEAPFEWTMAGDWIVTVTASLPDGRIATREFDLTVSGEMNMEP